MVPRSATAITASAFGMPLDIRVVPSIGSTATSQRGPVPSPTSSPVYSIGASSFSPSPITTTPRIETVPMRVRMASTAAPSPPFLSPRPTQRPAAMAAASVTRTSSRARLRSGAGRSVRKPRFVGEPSGTGSTGPPDRTTGAGSKGGKLCCDPRCMTAAGPPSQRPPRTDDVPAPDQEPAASASYPILLPQHLDDGYRPTSARTDAGNATAGDPVTLEIGYVTPSDEFAGFVVSDDRRADPVAAVLDGAEEKGSVDVGGTAWTRST